MKLLKLKKADPALLQKLSTNHKKKKKSLKELVEEVFNIPFHEFIDIHFQTGMSRKEIKRRINSLFLAQGKRVEFGTSQLYHTIVNNYSKMNFRFDPTFRGRKPGTTARLNEEYEVIFKCRSCGKKFKDHDLDFDSQDMFLKLRQYTCPNIECRKIGTCIAYISNKNENISAIKAVIPILIDEGITFQIECFIDSEMKMAENQDPFNLAPKKRQLKSSVKRN